MPNPSFAFGDESAIESVRRSLNSISAVHLVRDAKLVV